MKSNSSTNELEGKVALITGAASGISRATAVLLYEHGIRVVAEVRWPNWARQFEALTAPRRGIPSSGHRPWVGR